MQRHRRAARRATLVPGIGLLALSLTAVAANGSPSSAAQAIDCDAISGQALNIELAGLEQTSRVIMLRAGEALDFALETTAADSFGSLTLVAGATSPRPLVAGPAGTTVRFVAPAQGTFEFEFAREGEGEASFTVACTPAESAQDSARQNDSLAAQRAAELLAEIPKLRALPDPEISAYDIDVDKWSFDRDGRLAADTRRKPATRDLHTVRTPTALEVWLGANGERVPLSAQRKPPRDSGATVVSGAGLNYELMPQIMVGALLQFDQQGGNSMYGPPSLLDQGWVAGPVTTVRLAPGISFDARAAWGESGSASPWSAAESSAAERRLVNARLSATRTFGHWRFSPNVVVDYSEATQRSADPSGADGSALRTVGSGRVNIRPEISYRLDIDGSTFIEPKAAISSFWDIDSLSNLAPGSSGQEALRLKAEAGVTIGTTTGTTLQAIGAIEEDSAGAEDIWSGRFQLSVPLK